MGWFVIGVFFSFYFFCWAKFPSQKAELSSELVIVVVVPNGTKNENDVFFKNERKELFLFWNPKTYFQIQIWSWKEFRRKWPKRPLPTLFWSAALPSLTHAAFCLYNYKDTITRCQGFNNKITNKLTPKNHKNFTLKKNK